MPSEPIFVAQCGLCRKKYTMEQMEANKYMCPLCNNIGFYDLKEDTP